MRCLNVSCVVPLLALGVLGLAAQSGLAGPLTPPSGPVAPSMKTLQQVEPRIPINDTTTPGDATAMAVISQPGSYYLTADLVTTGNRAGIRILATNVTVDLNGMTIRCDTGATGSAGILDDGDTDNAPQSITIRNGRIADFSGLSRYAILFSGDGQLWIDQLSIVGCFGGVLAQNTAVRASSIDAVGTSATAGVALAGDNGSLYTDCTIRFFGEGLRASHSLARACVFNNCGIAASLDRSRLENSTISRTTAGSPIGVDAGPYSTVTGCTFNALTVGVQTNSVAQVIENNVFTGCSTGVLVEGEAATVRGNTFKQTTTGTGNGTCIRVSSFSTRAVIADNSGERFDFGVIVQGSGALITGNRFGHALNASSAVYQIAAGNRYGPLVRSQTGPAATASGNTATPTAGTMGSTDPTANFYW